MAGLICLSYRNDLDLFHLFLMVWLRIGNWLDRKLSSLASQLLHFLFLVPNSLDCVFTPTSRRMRLAWSVRNSVTWRLQCLAVCVGFRSTYHLPLSMLSISALYRMNPLFQGLVSSFGIRCCIDTYAEWAFNASLILQLQARLSDAFPFACTMGLTSSKSLAFLIFARVSRV